MANEKSVIEKEVLEAGLPSVKNLAQLYAVHDEPLLILHKPKVSRLSFF